MKLSLLSLNFWTSGRHLAGLPFSSAPASVLRARKESSLAGPAMCSLLLLLLCANCVSALPLTLYREHVKRAATALESLTLIDENESEAAYTARRAATLQDVRSIMPPEETIEWNNEKTVVDNRWLEEALKKYEEIPASEPHRVEALARITERLHALSEHLDELVQPQRTKEPTPKDEDKARLAAILRRAEYDKKAPQESALNQLLRRITEWLEKLIPKTKPLNPGPASAFALIARIIVYLLCMAIIGFFAWKYGPGLIEHLRRGRAKTEKRGVRVVLGERLEPDQTSADLLAEAEQLARQGDLRSAIRKAYIALLCELGDRKILRLAQHRTNRDYLHDLRDKESLYREMQQLTSSFENHWYGFTPATAQDWANFLTSYRKAVTSEK